MKRVIINADDFGSTSQVNEGIIRGHREGILTSATIMANGPASDQAVRLAKENAGLGVGIHLNIVCGKPVSPRDDVKTLVNSQGEFHRLTGLALRLFLGRIDLKEVRLEYSRQIEKLRKSGIDITHIDGEQHHQFLPRIFPIVLELANKYDIKKLRNARGLLSTALASFLKGKIGRSTGFFCFLIVKPYDNYIIRRSGSIRYTDHFFGLRWTGEMSAEKYVRIFNDLPEGTSEIMCHPGTVRDNELLDRPAELEALCDPSLKDLAGSKNIELISFREL